RRRNDHQRHRRVLRLQVRLADGCRHGDGCAVPAEPALGRRIAPAHRATSGRAGLRVGATWRGGVSRRLPSVADLGRRRLPPGGKALHDGRDRLHRWQAPQRRDRRGVDGAAAVGPATVGAGAAPGSGSRMTTPVGPANQSIVALGGGHGLYATLSAARRLTPYVTAIVTVADDGGSSGRL